MLPLAFLLIASVSVATTSPFEIANNKPFVRVSIDGSAPQWFILDTGNNTTSIIARECAERLALQRGAEEKVQIGAGSGVDAGLARAKKPVLLSTLGETLTVAEPLVLSLGHVARQEGRRVDGLLGADFLSRNVIELDYATRRITVRDPEGYVPPEGAVVVPLNLETGWPIAEGTVTPQGGKPIPCRLIIDTGVRGVVTFFRPFSARHGLYDAPGTMHGIVTGSGAGGISRGDVGRVEALALGSRSFAEPVAGFSRDTTGIFALDGPDGIVGGDLLKRHRVTFDCPHARMILEPYAEDAGGAATGAAGAAGATPFEYDMSGLFLTSDEPDYTKIRVVTVNPRTPAAEAGLRADDEIVAIDDRRAPKLSLDDARTLLRAPGARRLEVRRGGETLEVRLTTRRLV